MACRPGSTRRARPRRSGSQECSEGPRRSVRLSRGCAWRPRGERLPGVTGAGERELGVGRSSPAGPWPTPGAACWPTGRTRRRSGRRRPTDGAVGAVTTTCRGGRLHEPTADDVSEDRCLGERGARKGLEGASGTAVSVPEGMRTGRSAELAGPVGQPRHAAWSGRAGGRLQSTGATGVRCSGGAVGSGADLGAAALSPCGRAEQPCGRRWRSPWSGPWWPWRPSERSCGALGRGRGLGDGVLSGVRDDVRGDRGVLRLADDVVDDAGDPNGLVATGGDRRLGRGRSGCRTRPCGRWSPRPCRSRRSARPARRGPGWASGCGSS